MKAAPTLSTDKFFCGPGSIQVVLCDVLKLDFLQIDAWFKRTRTFLFVPSSAVGCRVAKNILTAERVR